MKPMRVCFGHRTAFQMLWALCERELAETKGAVPRLPDRALSERELDGLIERIEGDRPGLSIDRPVHFILGTASRCRSTSRRVPHVSTVKMRGKPFLRLPGGIGVCSAPLACVQVAPSAKDKIDLLELAYELCGTYRSVRTSAAPAYQVPALASARSLRDFVFLNPSIRGARSVVRILPYVAEGSASPRETKQALLLGLPSSYGGYGLGIPRMNHEVKASAAARAISGKRSFRCDLC